MVATCPSYILRTRRWSCLWLSQYGGLADTRASERRPLAVWCPWTLVLGRTYCGSYVMNPAVNGRFVTISRLPRMYVCGNIRSVTYDFHDCGVITKHKFTYLISPKTIKSFFVKKILEKSLLTKRPFLVPQRVGGWLDLGGWLHTEIVCPPEDGHLSQYQPTDSAVAGDRTNDHWVASPTP